MSPNKTLLMLAVLFGGGFIVSLFSQKVLESGVDSDVVSAISIVGGLGVLAILWMMMRPEHRAIQKATQPFGNYRSWTWRMLLMVGGLVGGGWFLVWVLQRVGAGPGVIRIAIPLLLLPICVRFMMRTVRKDAADFFGSPDEEIFEEGGGTLLSEEILVYRPDDPFEPEFYEILSATGSQVGTLAKSAGDDHAFVASDHETARLIVAVNKRRGRWYGTISDGSGSPVGTMSQRPRAIAAPLRVLFVIAAITLAGLLVAPFFLSRETLAQPATPTLVFVGLGALILTPVLGMLIWGRRYIPVFAFSCVDGTSGRLVPSPTEEFAFHFDLLGPGDALLARISRIWEEGLPRRFSADGAVFVHMSSAIGTYPRLLALAAPVVVASTQPPVPGYAQAMGREAMDNWKQGLEDAKLRNERDD
jgi:hypothetical protein